MWARLCYSGSIGSELRERARVFHKSEMDSDQIKLSPGTRLMPMRTGEGGGKLLNSRARE